MRRFLFPIAVSAILQACAVVPPDPGLGEPVAWDRLAGWQTDRHARAWPALRRGCERLVEQAPWWDICREVMSITDPTDSEARAFFEARFQPHPVHGSDGRRRGLITGYYEPLLNGRMEQGGPYQYPLYGPPSDLLKLKLGEAYPDLADRQLRGRLDGGTVKPYPARARIESNRGVLSGSELLWVDDAVDAFFLHVQGSGRVRLPDGRVIGVGFADHNGHPYRSIGRRLIETGEMSAEEVNLFSLRAWLRSHPHRARELMHHNPRFVFFRMRETATAPTGSLNVPLTAGRSLAVDDAVVPLGAPVWLETSTPGQPDEPLNRLMLAQDTGGAIKGHNRADVFWGSGKEAEKRAGLMKHSGRMFVLLPKVE